MSRLEETPLFYNSAAADHEETGYGCFRQLCCGWSNGGYSAQDGPHRESWIGAKLMKLREFTEVVAGPKWKNLIRKLGRICNTRRYDKSGAAQFQYSPESYALNFAGDGAEEDGRLMHSFSTRYAPGTGMGMAGDDRRSRAVM